MTLRAGGMADKDSYGAHLMMRVGDIEHRMALSDPEAVSRFLVSLVDRVGMSILAGPMVQTEQGGPERFGVSGVVILCESHAAVHTYPALGQTFLDLFSCRPFDPADVVGVITECFGRHRIVESEMVARGRHWGTDVAEQLRSWTRAR